MPRLFIFQTAQSLKPEQRKTYEAGLTSRLTELGEKDPRVLLFTGSVTVVDVTELGEPDPKMIAEAAPTIAVGPPIPARD